MWNGWQGDWRRRFPFFCRRRRAPVRGDCNRDSNDQGKRGGDRRGQLFARLRRQLRWTNDRAGWRCAVLDSTGGADRPGAFLNRDWFRERGRWRRGRVRKRGAWRGRDRSGNQFYVRPRATYTKWI